RLLHDAALQRLPRRADADPRPRPDRPSRAARPGRRGLAHPGAEARRPRLARRARGRRRRKETRPLTLKHPKAGAVPTRDLSFSPIFALEGDRIPRQELPTGSLPPDVAYQIVHDELMLDGNARMNLATFVTTWMEPQAEKLMAECLDKNMIDKDEYPQ